MPSSCKTGPFGPLAIGVEAGYEESTHFNPLLLFMDALLSTLSLERPMPPSASVFPTLELEATTFNATQLTAHLLKLEARGEPQIAFAGRSNVGKSSLINALAGRKSLAKTSATPGKTRSVNFYRAASACFTLADLPGYGYARCSKAERTLWAKLIEHYLTSARTLRAVALLLDCRLDPQRLDRELANYVRGLNLTLLPVLTKADKCTQAMQADRQRQWALLLDGTRPLVVSSASRRGIDTLWKAMLAYCPSPASDDIQQA